jgi:pimeloyl-ACP methyl ester carboxylesterase
MGAARGWLRALGALTAAGGLLGCSTPVGIRSADPHEVQRYLTRSALTDNRPSDWSLNQLRRYDLLRTFEKDPDVALAKLHAAALAEDFPPMALFALAELSFLRANQTKQQSSYAAAMIYSWATLFPERGRPLFGELDPRERIAADLYNRSLTSAFKRTKEGTIQIGSGGEFALPFGRVTVTQAPHMLELYGSELYDLRPVAEIEVRGLRNRYRRPGIGAPLGAKMRPLPGATPVVPTPAVVLMPLTALVRIESPLAGLRSGDLHARAQLYESLEIETVEIEGRQIPLETEPTAALAASLTESQFWKKELGVFFGNATGVRQESRLFGLRPYRPGRIPVVFVHGTASSAARWADMINDLSSDTELRQRYAMWFFAYDSGNPIAYSGMQLRDSLTEAVNRADPRGSDPCARDMVVMGHSQGGLLTKLTVIDSKNIFWEGITKNPFDDLEIDPKDKALLRSALFVKPLPFVREVIFLATPQRGSYLAGPQFVRRLAQYFVRLPSDVVRLGTYTTAGAGLPLAPIPTSIDNMSPGNRFIKALATIPVAPDVIAHSIISIDPEGPLEGAGDGVVKYQSAHVDGLDSELVVISPHSGMQAAPATVEEVRRILYAHAERSKCPPPLPPPPL